MRTAWSSLEKQAEWLEREYPSAAASLREGLEEMFTASCLQISPSLARCLVTTNVIESPHRGVRLPTRRVCRWRDGQMVLRWAAAARLETEIQLDSVLVGDRSLVDNEPKESRRVFRVGSKDQSSAKYGVFLNVS